MTYCHGRKSTISSYFITKLSETHVRCIVQLALCLLPIYNRTISGKFQAHKNVPLPLTYQTISCPDSPIFELTNAQNLLHAVCSDCSRKMYKQFFCIFAALALINSILIYYLPHLVSVVWRV